MRTCTVWLPPAPAVCTDSGASPSVSATTFSTDSAVISEEATGTDIWVPPSKSMPRVNPRIPIEARQISRIAAVTPYHMRRRPTIWNAPVPV
ncbi:Uncharacterised protein [Clostridioides difficile]|nr:Uncharacterised protein [Clostridioides difficile]